MSANFITSQYLRISFESDSANLNERTEYLKKNVRILLNFIIHLKK